KGAQRPGRGDRRLLPEGRLPALWRRLCRRDPHRAAGRVRLPALAPAAARHPPRATARGAVAPGPAAERRRQARPPCARRPAATERGRLWVRTPSLFSGYVNRPDLTAQVLEDGWLNTQDLAYFDEDRCVHVLGRCDGTINKGGNLFHLNEC
ncbi:TPA: AMP-binding protein, partial [Pseudomonas aeruginosa]|nr:AMP-binding protein [Pseudomonas aeruginosa]